MDKRSKVWAAARQLAPPTLLRIQTAFPGIRIENVDFTQISNSITRAQRAKERVVVVHPVWPGQSWWEKLAQSRTVALNIGNYDSVFVTKPCESTPEWRFQASLLN